MSKPAPQAPAKPNFLSPILFAIAAVLMLRTCQDSKPSGPTYKDSTSVLTEMRKIDAQAKWEPKQAQDDNDRVVRQLLPTYLNLVKDEVKAKKTTEFQADDLETQASILAAHVQVKAAEATNDTNKFRMAYTTLEKFERTHADKAAWTTTPVDVSENGTSKTITGHAFLQSLIAKISERNKSDLIWGAIPGGYQFIDFLVGLTGHNPVYSYAFATLLLAFVVRAAVFPLSQKQLMMSRKMSQLTPQLVEIKSKFKDDQVEMNRRSMELYGRYGINPFAGCLPAFVQMPLFLAVYQCILHYQFEFTKGYFLWINPASSKASNGFFAPNLGQQDYILIVIYSVTMIISTLLTPVNDPTQAKQQRLIGVGAAVIIPVMMLLHVFPVVSGFVLYWTFTNLFSMAQSLRAYRMPMPELVEVNAPGGGVYPSKPKGKWAQWMEDAQKMAEEQQKGGKSPPSAPGKGKISPSRPVGEEKNDDEGEGGAGTPAKHKPKRRR